MRLRYGYAALIAALLAAGCAGAPEAPETAGVAVAENGTVAESAPAAGPIAAAAGEGLGLSRARMVEVLVQHGLPEDAFGTVALPDGRQVLSGSYPDTATRQVLWVAIFGGEDAPHTVRIDYYPTNAAPEEAQTTGRVIDGLLVALFPDWPEATQWPEVAGNRAWQETARHLDAEGGEVQEVPILETRQDDVWLEVLGVPLHMVSYVITTNENCRPSQADGYFEGFPACR